MHIRQDALYTTRLQNLASDSPLKMTCNSTSTPSPPSFFLCLKFHPSHLLPDISREASSFNYPLPSSTSPPFPSFLLKTQKSRFPFPSLPPRSLRSLRFLLLNKSTSPAPSGPALCFSVPVCSTASVFPSAVASIRSLLVIRPFVHSSFASLVLTFPRPRRYLPPENASFASGSSTYHRARPLRGGRLAAGRA
jgi:hypothetical protein